MNQVENRTVKESIVAFARHRGFDLVRCAPASLPDNYERTFKEWVASGQHGTMAYLRRRLEEQRSVYTILPGVRSVITLGVNYYRSDRRRCSGREGQVSRYAITRDYHKTIGRKLKELCRFIADEFGGESRPYIDTGPILERAYAETGGLGYIGKNTCIITQEFGSWIFLAEILTTLSLPADTRKVKIHCGECRRCIDRCPTGAINEDHTIDARKCISYLTIENRDGIPESLRPLVGNWLFGCDICQEVCPHNVRAQAIQADDRTTVRIKDRAISIETILEIESDDEFLSLFAGTPLMRAKRRGMIRNACVVAGNSGDRRFVPLLRKIAGTADPMLAEHARWAVARLTATANNVESGDGSAPA